MARNWLPLSGFTAIAVFYYFLTWSSELPILGNDHPVYLLMADHFSLFTGLRPEVTSVAMRYSPFPPFYPLVLAMFGGTSAHMEIAHAITTTFLVLALLFYFVWVESETGSSFKAFLLSVIFAFLSTTLLQSFGILSENLYLLLTLLVIWLVSKQDISLSRLYAAAVIIGLAAITRTIGIALILAFATHLFLHKQDHRIRLIFVSLVPILFWNFLRWLFDYKGGYLWVVTELVSTRSLYDLLSKQLSIESHALWVGWITSFDHLPSPMTLIAGSMIGAICLAGTLRRAYLGRMEAIYTIFYLGIILLWPFSLEAKRLLYVVVPILLFHGFELIQDLLRRFSSGKILSYVYPLVIVLIAFPATGTILGRAAMATGDESRVYANSSDWYSEGDLDTARIKIKSHKKLIQSWKRVSEVVPAGECVYHVDAPSLMLHADRRSYTPPMAAVKEKFLKAAKDCRYFYVGSYTRVPYWQLFYPRDFIADEGRIVFADRMDDMEGTPILGMLIEMSR